MEGFRRSQQNYKRRHGLKCHERNSYENGINGTLKESHLNLNGPKVVLNKFDTHFYAP